MNRSSRAIPVPASGAEVAFREFWRVAGLLKRAMEPRFAQFGISPAQWAILRALHRSETSGAQPPRVTDLSRQLFIRPPSVTGVVNRLERMRMVTKIASRGDQRFRRVRLTDSGRQLVNRVLAGHPAWIKRLMMGLSRREQATLSALLGKLSTHLESAGEHSAWMPEVNAAQSVDGAVRRSAS
jgi:DNA-binding MarR family transcriptional regulator